MGWDVVLGKHGANEEGATVRKTLMLSLDSVSALACQSQLLLASSRFVS